MGIAFQGWSNQGWAGSIGDRYFLLRDRKGLITAPTALLAYFVMMNLIVLEIVFQIMPGNNLLQYTLLDTPAYRMILELNIVFLINRIAQRTYFTMRIYGPARSLMAGPRMIVSNFLNFFATMRALYIFVQHKMTGKPIVWDKTDHTYPVGVDGSAAAL